MSFEFFISARYLKKGQKNRFITLIMLLSIVGIAVGVMALVVVISVMAGFESDLRTRILGSESHIVISKKTGKFFASADTVKELTNDKAISAARPFLSSEVIFRSASNVAGGTLKGIPPRTASKFSNNIFNHAMVERFMSEANQSRINRKPGIIIGKELARNLGVIEGDQVEVISPRGMVSPIGHVPRMKSYEILGFFETGLYQYDSNLAFSNIKDVQRLLLAAGNISGIELLIGDIYQAPQLARNIKAKLGTAYDVRDWGQMNRNLYWALKLEKIVMFIILTLITLVAAFNITSALIMMVMEKTKEIAILKTMGARGKSIRKIFMLKGMIVGVSGIAVGVCTGFFLCLFLKQHKINILPGDIYYITSLPVNIDPWTFILTGAAAFVICFFSTLLPSHQASKFNPVDAIRFG